MASNICNIEIGKRIVKVCRTQKKGKRYQISDSFLFAAPDECVADGQIVNPALLGQRLSSELAAHGVSGGSAVFTLSSGTRIASRLVSLPSAKDETLQGIVATNASEYLPIDVSKYRTASTVLERSKEESRLNVVAVPNPLVDSYIALADAAGLTIEALDFSGNSQYQVLRGLGSEGVTMYVTIDDGSAMVTFMEGANLLLQRCLTFGGDEMITAYLQDAGLSSEQYLDALQALSVSAEKAQPEADTAPYEALLTRLVGGIARSTDFFSSANENARIERVVLMGSCCHLAGLKEQIARRLDLPTLWLEEISGTQGLANSILGISMFISCLGARIAPMGFLPAEYITRHKRGSRKKNSHYGLVALIGCAVIAAALCIPQVIGYGSRQRELSSLNKKIESLNYAEDRYNAYVTYTEGDKALQAFANQAATPNAQLEAFLTELEKKMPSDVSFMSATCTAPGISMTVECPGFDEASVVIRQLRSFETLGAISVGPITQATNAGGMDVVTFTLTAAYAAEEAPAEPAPQPAEAANDDLLD